MSKKSPGSSAPAKRKNMVIQTSPVSLKDIANACGVSRMTVSYALRGNRQYVSEKTIAIVSETASKLGYDPTLNHAARKLGEKHSRQRVINHLIAVFFPYDLVTIPYYNNIMRGMQANFASRHYGVLSCRIDPAQKSISQQLPYLFRRGDVDGVMLVVQERQLEVIDCLRKESGFADRPIVTVIDQAPDCSCVIADDVEAGRLQAAHLLDLGHRHLMCFRSGQKSVVIPNNRMEGFLRAYRERGLNGKELLEIVPWVWGDPAGMDAAMAKVMREHPRVTGLLMPNDGVTNLLAPVLYRLGMRIPKDLSVVSVDDCESLTGPGYSNILTTVQIPLAEIGQQAATVLMDQVELGNPAPISKKLPVSLVMRGSTAALKKQA